MITCKTCGGELVAMDENYTSNTAGYRLYEPGHVHDQNATWRRAWCAAGHENAVAIRRRCNDRHTYAPDVFEYRNPPTGVPVCDWVEPDREHHDHTVDAWPEIPLVSRASANAQRRPIETGFVTLEPMAAGGVIVVAGARARTGGVVMRFPHEDHVILTGPVASPTTMSIVEAFNHTVAELEIPDPILDHTKCPLCGAPDVMNPPGVRPRLRVEHRAFNAPCGAMCSTTEGWPGQTHPDRCTCTDEKCPRCGALGDCPDPTCGDEPPDPNAWRPRKFA